MSSRSLDDLLRGRWRESVRARFWRYVDKRGPDDCWPWIGSMGSTGYGQLSIRNHPYKAHRVAYTLETGDVGSSNVLHRCDNPPCVNPGHLFLGSQRDNLADALAKGRARRAHGEANGRSKLTAGSVRFARSMYSEGLSMREIARRLGTDHKTISMVIGGRTWSHVEN